MALYESLPVSVALVLLQLLTRLGTWALVRASSTSWPKYTSTLPFEVGANLRINVLRKLGGPEKYGGDLANKRWQMNDRRYRAAGGIEPNPLEP
jgi:hypothetical protein